MGVGFRLVSRGGNSVAVNKDGELRSSPIADKSKFHNMDSTGTAFSFFPPIDGSQFCITLMRYKAAQNVQPTTDAEVIVYQDDAADGTAAAADDILHQDALVRGQAATIPALLLVDAGKFLNAKTSDATIPMTIMGHYVKER